jgi:hypothetical protein
MVPLDPAFNATILSIAARLFPDGFDVSPDAPSTYKALKVHLDAGKRLVVYDGGCEGTIYANPKVNHALRAWHDWSHWKGGHDFSVEGETGAFNTQRQHLIDLYGENEQTRRWTLLLHADIVGFRLYYERHKRFVDDQRGFIEAYMKSPDDTLLCPLW